MKLTLKSFIIIALFFATVITSLWPNNIYILCLFSFASLVLLPFRRWWDGISISLLFFSMFYCLIQRMNATSDISSGFLFIATLVAPVAFYRFGCWVMEWLSNDKYRLWFLFTSVLCYLLPMFLLTITDIRLGGFINESRDILGNFSDNSLAATLYGLMSSVGLGFISVLFAKQLKIGSKLLYTTIPILSMLTVLHLVNRSGVVILGICIIFSFIYSSKFHMSKTIYAIFIMSIIFVVLKHSGIIGEDIIDAYLKREEIETNSAANLGGRSELWALNFYNLFTNPLGWHRAQYAHNLWLDMAAIGGWLALTPFLIATINVLGCFMRIFRRMVTPLNLILLTSFVSMFCNAMVEPVIEGSLLFFVLFLMNWGMLKSTCRYNANS